jgi:site-specific DNA recombinase
VTARLADLHDQVRRHESRLDELDGTIAALEAERLRKEDVLGAFTEFDKVWQCLTAREQQELVRLIVGRAEFDAADSTIEVTFHSPGIRALVAPSMEEAA